MSTPFPILSVPKLSFKNGNPYSERFKDYYYSTDGGLEESSYVFIEGNQLIERFKRLPKDGRFVIGELGFGTGLNFLLVSQLFKTYAPKSAHLFYFSCEQYPLSLSELSQCVEYWPVLQKEAQDLIAQYPLRVPGFHTRDFERQIHLTLMFEDVLSAYKQLLICGDSTLEPNIRHYHMDAWFLDGFAPSRNEMMWQQSVFEVITLLSTQGTTLATYSVAASVKAHLAACGFAYAKRPGYLNKRECLSATFVEQKELKVKRTTPWHYTKPIAHVKRAIVVGAGLAGCMIARCLSEKGIDVHVFDQEKSEACGASANTQAILYPKLSAFRSPFTELLLHCFLYAIPFYRTLLRQREGNIGELSGILQFVAHEREKKTQSYLHEWLLAYPELAQFVNQEQASLLAGIPIHEPGLWIREAGWFNMVELCKLLIQKAGITCHFGKPVKQLVYQDNLWHVNECTAEVAVIATGYQLANFEQTQYLSLKPIRGQTTTVPTQNGMQSLKIPLCGSAHLMPINHTTHSIGSTYHLHDKSDVLTSEDDMLNIKRINQLPIAHPFGNEIMTHWTGVRGAFEDYLPIVGPVAKAEDFYACYAPLASDRKRWLPALTSYYRGLYAFAGFGSRGLALTPLCAAFLAKCINNEPDCLPRSLIQSMSTARVLMKQLKKR